MSALPDDGHPDGEARPEKAAEAQLRIARSSEALRDSADAQSDSADRRTILAADRTVLAAERTYAAWVRTGLAALAAGIGARALLDRVVPVWLAGATGTVLILFSGFCFFAGVWREVRADGSWPRPDTPRLPAWLLIGVNAFLALVSVAAVVGVWMQ